MVLARGRERKTRTQKEKKKKKKKAMMRRRSRMMRRRRIHRDRVWATIRRITERGSEVLMISTSTPLLYPP